jgi:predicted PolB exonuclease-like 3'-5' exonuclease
MTPRHVIVWDLETIPDLAAAARIHGAQGPAREALGDTFPKLPLHKIACIGALIAEWQDHSWKVRSLGAPHIGERSESELISSFIEQITELCPQLVTYNGTSFDLPVFRYRAMVNRVSAPGLHARDYFRRYTDDAIDLCDVLSSFDARSKISLNDLCRILGLPGKPDGMDGSQVERYVNEGRIDEVSAYCENDVVNTYRVFLIHELFAGKLTHAAYAASEDNLSQYLTTRISMKAHYSLLIEPR